MTRMTSQAGNGAEPSLPNGSLGGTCALQPNTRVLAADRTWRPAGDLQIGDHVLAVDVFPVLTPSGVRRRHWRQAVVTRASLEALTTMQMTFSDGEVLTVGSGHTMLAQYAGGWSWRTVEHIADYLHDPRRKVAGIEVPQPYPLLQRPAVNYHSQDYMAGYVAGATLGDGSLRADENPYWQIGKGHVDVDLFDRLEAYLAEFGICASRYHREPNGLGWQRHPVTILRTNARESVRAIAAMCDNPSQSMDYSAGWLAGLYDTDGGVSNGPTYHQKDVKVLERVDAAAAAHGFTTTGPSTRTGGSNTTAVTGSRVERVRFLDFINPALERKREQLEGHTLQMKTTVRVTAIRTAPPRPMVVISTETGTLIAGGTLASAPTARDAERDHDS